MQSSYNVIKKNFANDGSKRVIETKYITKKVVTDPIIDEDVIEQEQIDETPKIDPEELMKRYEDIGQRIIQDAKNEKQAILLKAQMEASGAEKKGYEKGYEQGIQNGYDDGYKKAYDETINNAKLEAEQIIKNAEDLLKSAQDDYLNYLEQKKKEILKLSLEIAENIVKKELSCEDSMNSLIEEALKISKEEDNVILKVNSFYAEELKSQVEKWKISYGIKNEIFVLADDSMEQGNAILEKPSGIVNVGIDIGMEQIKKALFN